MSPNAPRAACLCALLACLATPALAQPAPPPPPDPPAPDGPLVPASAPVSSPDLADAPPRITVGGRVLAGWRTRWARGEDLPNVASDGDQAFFVQQARLKLKGKLNRYIRFKLSGDLDNASLRDAYAELRAHRALRLRVGRFKRPFSRIELRSVGDLPVPGRGLFNDAMIEGAHFGDRSVGAMLGGKYAGLQWKLAAMHPDAPASGVSGMDLIARTEYDLTKWLELGLGAGHKSTQRLGVGVTDLSLLSFGADARVDLGGVYGVLEWTMAQNPAPARAATESGVGTPWARALNAYVSYDHALADKLVLQPTVAAEWYDADAEMDDDGALRGVLGVNVIYDRDSRLLVQYERFTAVASSLDRRLLPRNRFYLLASVDF